MKTKAIYQPENNRLIEEKDFIFWGLKVYEIRRFSYNSNGDLSEVSYFDRANRWIKTEGYFYNANRLPYLETSKYKESNFTERTFYLRDSKDRVFTIISESRCGLQYMQEFSFDNKGDQIRGLHLTLAPVEDISELYRKLMKKHCSPNI